MNQRLLFLSILIMLILSGCIRVHEVRGNLVDNEKLTQLRPGLRQEEITNLLGSPSSVSPFNDKVWYYIGSKESHIAFFSPRIDQACLLKLVFSPEKRLESLILLDPRERQQVVFSKSTTYNQSYQQSLFRRVFGNVGKFSTPPGSVRPRFSGEGS